MRSELEVADIFRRHGHAYRVAHDGHLDRVERRAMSAIELWRTEALGGHVEACEDCARARVSYDSCRNRHCPKCQNATRERWLADSRADLLPVHYFHVVFTVPAEVAEIAFHNKAVVYAILFDAVAATLKTIAADPRPSAVRSGSWPLFTHGPGAHPSSAHPLPRPRRRPLSRWGWFSCRPRFFLPIHVLSRLFRRLFLELLQAAYGLCGWRLRFSGTLDGLGQAHAFMAAIRQLRRKNGIVYAKPPFSSPVQVLAYLDRYTHRLWLPRQWMPPTRLAIIRQLLVAMKLAPTAAAGETTKLLPRFDPTV
ncbi:hypothetical protein X753_31570 [Mesorhizobium sp. LNJC399B00]|nr:hypothetical protein X753_31570 [Mesorhizobium sp. LNJC399B00]